MSMAVSAAGAIVVVNTVVVVQSHFDLAEEWTVIVLMAFDFD